MCSRSMPALFPPSSLLSLCATPSDLVPREVVEKWLKYLREELPTVAFKCNVQSQRANLGRVRQPKGRPYGGLTSAGANKEKEGGGAGGTEEDNSSSKCLGAETLIQLLKNYCRSKDVRSRGPSHSTYPESIDLLSGDRQGMAGNGRHARSPCSCYGGCVVVRGSRHPSAWAWLVP